MRAIKCQFCKKEVFVEHHSIIYCSKQCSINRRNIKQLKIRQLGWSIKNLIALKPVKESRVQHELLRQGVCSNCGCSYSKYYILGYCSKECRNIMEPRTKKANCLWCHKEMEFKMSDNRKFCCRQHKGLYESYLKYGFTILHVEPNEIVWSHFISYLIGLITSDGSLVKRGGAVIISSKDKSHLEKIRDLVSVIITGTYMPISEEHKTIEDKDFITYKYRITSMNFYQFCTSIGLMPNKTKILNSLTIPDEFFSDFLRGILDGDGNYNVRYRIVNNRKISYFYIRLTSGSKAFLEWLNNECYRLIGVKGTVYCDKRKQSTYNILWMNAAECNKIIEYIYKDCDLYLERKWERLQSIKWNLYEIHSFVLNNRLPLVSTIINE